MRIIAGGERSIEGFFGIERESGDAAVAGFELHQHLAEPRVAGRTGYQRDIRRPLENLFAFLLGHTTEHANDLPLAGIALEVLQTIEYFLLRLIANAARIKEDELRVSGLLHARVTLRKQSSGDFLRVVGIHLAAEGLYVESLGGHSRIL